MAELINAISGGIGFFLPFEWATHDFMRRALLAIILIGPAAAAIGIHMINFRMSFFSDAISHSAFTGIALGLLMNLDPVLTMIAFGLLVGLIIVRIRKRSRLSVDTIIGVAFSTSVALGIVIISARRGLTRNLHSFVYGDVLAVREVEILLMFFLAAAVFAFTFFMYNRLVLMAVNEEIAKTRGVNTALYEYIFSILLTLVVCLSIRVVGILLVTALIIVPAAVGRTLSRNVGELFWFSIIAALAASISGLILSYYWDSATGATVVLVCSVFFVLAQFVKGLRPS